MISVRWLGRGGQGCFTAARILGAAAVIEGRYALAFPSFGPERRGAPVLGFTRIDNFPVTDRSEVKSCDYLVVMDDSILDENVVKALNPGGVLIANTTNISLPFIGENIRFVGFDASQASIKFLGKPIVNTALLGALAGVSGIVRLESAERAVLEDAGIKQAQKNVELLKFSWETVKNAKA